jgi:HK97 gp10 family phage protein
MSVTVITLEDHFKDAIAAATGEQLKKAVMAGGYVIEAHAKLNASAGRPGLNVDTGNLVNSIHTELVDSSETSAEVNVGTGVIYAAIHEFGGVIEPVTAKLLSWVDDGVRVFANLVHIPARPYLRPAAEENTDEILAAVGEQLRRQIEGTS